MVVPKLGFILVFTLSLSLSLPSPPPPPFPPQCERLMAMYRYVASDSTGVEHLRLVELMAVNQAETGDAMLLVRR